LLKALEQIALDWTDLLESIILDEPTGKKFTGQLVVTRLQIVHQVVFEVGQLVGQRPTPEVDCSLQARR
jgi:hypothetical protein